MNRFLPTCPCECQWNWGLAEYFLLALRSESEKNGKVEVGRKAARSDFSLGQSDCSEEKPLKVHRSKYAVVEVRDDRSLDKWLP